MVKYELFDVAEHDVNCGLKKFQTRMPCQCCKGALIFQEAKLIKEKLTGGSAMPNKKDRDFKTVPATACWGI